MPIYWVLLACSGFFLLCIVVTIFASDNRSGRLEVSANPWFRRFGLLFLLTFSNWLLLTPAGPFVLTTVALLLWYVLAGRQSRLLRAVFPSPAEVGSPAPEEDAGSS